MKRSVNRWTLVVLVSTLGMISSSLTGCDTLDRVINQVEKPGVRLVGGALSGLTLDDAEIMLDVEVSNPYEVPLPIAAVDLALISRSSKLVESRLTEPAVIAAGSSRTLQIPMSVTFAHAMRVLSQVRPGQVLPYEAQATVRIDAPGVGPLSFPLAHRGEFPIPAVPEISIREIEFEELSLSNAAAVVRVALSNPNAFEAIIENFGYSLDLSGVTVGRGSVEQATSLRSNGTGELVIPLRFSPRDLGLALFQTLLSGETSYRLHGGIDVRTPFGSLDMPVDRSGATPLLR